MMLPDLNDFIWADSWEAAQRAKSLRIISGIVDRYGGTITVIDLANNVLEIDVPNKYKVECASEVQEAIDGMR